MFRATIIGLLVIAVYLPSFPGGFLLDDDIYLTKNPIIRSSEGLKYFWFTGDAKEYLPVISTSLWFEWRLWGMNPAGYRATNLALHIAEAILLWKLLERLKIPGAYFAAVIFAVHPVNIQTVAWIAQRKNLMAMLFFLLSIWWFLNFDDTGRWKWYLLSILCCFLSMLSKGSAAVVPVVILCLIGWRRPIRARDLLLLSPFLIICCLLSVVILSQWVPSLTVRHVGLLYRTLAAGAVPWFYLYKAILPLQLIFIYPNWKVDPSNWLWWIPACATAAATIAIVFLKLPKSIQLAWIIFLLTLLPVMGFVDTGYMKFTLVSDHYQYIAIIVPIVMFAALANRRVILLVIGVLCLLTLNHSALYSNAQRLYEATVRANPNAWIIQNNLGVILLDQNKVSEAESHFHQCLDQAPEYPQAHSNLGIIFAKRGDAEGAQGEFGLAVKYDPQFASAHANLGRIYAIRGYDKLAMDELRTALKLDPQNQSAHRTVGQLLDMAGNHAEAEKHFKMAEE